MTECLEHVDVSVRYAVRMLQPFKINETDYFTRIFRQLRRLKVLCSVEFS